MPWDSDFEHKLHSQHKHVKYRLVIGTYGVSPNSATGRWEQGGHGLHYCCEITSHGDGSNPSDYPGTTFRTVQGLTRQMNFGGQAVSVRSWDHQQSSLTVGVLNYAATKVLPCVLGTMAKMEMSINGSNYNTIFVGVYQGMSWQMGGEVTLTFRDALSWGQTRSSDDQTHVDHKSHSNDYTWFKGIGVQSYVTAAPCTPGSTSIVDLTAMHYAGATYDVVESSLNYNHRLDDAWRIHDVDLLGFYEGGAGSGTAGNSFCFMVPDGGDADDQYFLQYSHVTSSGSAGVLNTPVATTTSETTAGGFGSNPSVLAPTGSVLKSVFPIYGNPICELANTLYGYGYHKNMVGALFGRYSTSARASSYTDYDHMDSMARAWNQIYQANRGTTSSTGRAPFRHVVTSEQRDGFGYLKGKFAKMGVFPSFRRGAYTVGIGLDPHTMAEAGVRVDKIERDDIMSVSWDLCDTGARTIYAGWNRTHSDLDSGGASTVGAGSEGATSINLTSPLIGGLEVKTTDVAPSSYAADGFGNFFDEQIFQPWYGTSPPSRATVVLKGLRWAKRGLGELIEMDLGETSDGVNGWRQRLFGPSRRKASGRTEWKSVLDSARGTARDDLHYAWLITGINIDWNGGFVTLEMHRPHCHEWAQRIVE